MAGIKDINTVSGTGNPVQMQDLQNIWEALTTLMLPRGYGPANAIGANTPYIVSGFMRTSAGFSPGVILYQGVSYYSANTLQPNTHLYVQRLSEDSRTYEDGTARMFYNNYVVNNASNATTTGIGTYIGQLTPANADLWKAPYLRSRSVIADSMADNAVVARTIANNSVALSKTTISVFSVMINRAGSTSSIMATLGPAYSGVSPLEFIGSISSPGNFGVVQVPIRSDSRYNVLTYAAQFQVGYTDFALMEGEDCTLRSTGLTATTPNLSFRFNGGTAFSTAEILISVPVELIDLATTNEVTDISE